MACAWRVRCEARPRASSRRASPLGILTRNHPSGRSCPPRPPPFRPINHTLTPHTDPTHLLARALKLFTRTVTACGCGGTGAARWCGTRPAPKPPARRRAWPGRRPLGTPAGCVVPPSHLQLYCAFTTNARVHMCALFSVSLEIPNLSRSRRCPLPQKKIPCSSHRRRFGTATPPLSLRRTPRPSTAPP